jgi:endogenous inhibitor of DNA gyrase (YacG/DUF329 family)
MMKCPICKKEFQLTSGEGKKHYPFCSDRCRLIDLGRWLDGKYQIPIAPEHEEPLKSKSPRQ